MLNIEKYKNEIINSTHADLRCCVLSDILHLRCIAKCSECKKYVVEWLLEEYKEPILDEVEREYLSAVIKPFRNRVTSVRKWFNGIDYQIIITLDHAGALCQLPRFPLGSEMYKSMEVCKYYTPEELGL